MEQAEIQIVILTAETVGDRVVVTEYLCMGLVQREDLRAPVELADTVQSEHVQRQVCLRR